MPCYFPKKGWKAKDGTWVSKRPSDTAPVKMDVRCGGCLGCRTEYSKMWMARIVHEAHGFEHNCFLTLTYRDPDQCDEAQLRAGHYVPADGSLNKKHYQDFMKRLRKHFTPKRIRYYHCGEYGDENYRPHYHAILFNLDFGDKQVHSVKEGIALYTSPTLDALWPFGFATIGTVTPESAAYVSRYAMKKITGHKAETHYLRCDEYGVAYWLQPEYATMSRRPGIGRAFYDEFKSDIFPSDEIPIPGLGISKTVPRYYEQILAGEDPDTHETVKHLREAFRLAHGSEYSPQRLEAKYAVASARMGMLPRSL